MEGAEAAAERRGGGHRAAPRAAGEGGADERGEGGEAEEDLQQEVLPELVYGRSSASLRPSKLSAAFEDAGYGCRWVALAEGVDDGGACLGVSPAAVGRRAAAGESAIAAEDGR